MSWKLIFFQTIGGLGLFLYGMRIMSDSLQRVAGERMRKILAAVSANRWVACLTGTLVTGVIQSSSATTVMIVGFTNAGLLTIQQAVGLVLGANIGTTMTAQLIAFKITDLALPCIGLGAAMRLFAGKKRTQDLGGILLGFGMLFYGMVIMSDGVAPLKQSAAVVEFFTRFDTSHFGGILLCVAVGTVVTMVLQSSSATVGLTIALATQGLLTFPTAVALVLGDNIGTTITAELAGIGTDYNARRTARAHTMFNVLGVCYMVLIFPYFVGLVEWLTSSFMGLGPADAIVEGNKPNIARYIANAHTMFNVINASVFLVGLPLLIRVATAITIKGPSEEQQDLYEAQYLDSQFLDVPAVALEEARQEIIRMGGIAERMMSDVIHGMETRSLKDMGDWKHKENALDSLQKKITDYLVQVSQRDITLEESKRISSSMRMVNNIERIGDTVQNIAELIEEMVENNVELSPEGVEDFKKISGTTMDFFRFLLDSMKTGQTNIMEKSREYEESIDLMREEMRGNHLTRLRGGVCSIDPGLIFTDMLNHFEKIGDYCFNVCQAVAGIK
jgi:phosphate:Na+ symporter